MAESSFPGTVTFGTACPKAAKQWHEPDKQLRKTNGSGPSIELPLAMRVPPGLNAMLHSTVQGLNGDTYLLSKPSI